MVEKLVKELNYKPEEVYQLNWINALNWLTMFSMKERWIKEQQKKIK
jgi:sulfur relay (sulfurtransferase) DsrF/TusC family protein